MPSFFGLVGTFKGLLGTNQSTTIQVGTANNPAPVVYGHTSLRSFTTVGVPEVSINTSFVSYVDANGQLHNLDGSTIGVSNVQTITVSNIAVPNGGIGCSSLYFLQKYQVFTVDAGLSASSLSERSESDALHDAEEDLDKSLKKGVIVYDVATGAVKLLHTFVGLPGECLPDDQTIEREALSLAQRLLNESFPAAVLPVNLAAMKEGVRYEVDLSTKTLRELVAKQEQ